MGRARNASGARSMSAPQRAGRYARRVGLDVTAYSDHRLRSGFLTSAAESGASVFKMTEVSRHRSLDTLRGSMFGASICSKSMPGVLVPAGLFGLRLKDGSFLFEFGR